MKAYDKALEQINQAALRLLEPLEPEKVYEIIVEEAMRLVSGTEGLILLVSSKKQLEKTYISSPSLALFQVPKRGLAYKAFVEQKTYTITPKEYAKVFPRLRKIDYSIIAIPLSYKNNSVGVLLIHAPKNIIFTERELSILRLFGALSSLAVRKTQLYKETQKALETRDLFISMAAHEFKTPITTISGYLQLLKRRLLKGKRIQGEWVDHLTGEVKRLTQLLNELLEISRIKTGRLQFSWKECHVRSVLRQVVQEVSLSRPNRKIVLEDRLGNKKDIVIGDFNKLLQVFINLLDNALKFSPEETEVTLTLRQKASFLRIEVKDKGVGISKEELPKILQEFYRGKNQMRPGMGLGLFLAKSIVEQHKGSIKIKSKLKEGTVVTVNLPKIKI